MYSCCIYTVEISKCSMPSSLSLKVITKINDTVTKQLKIFHGTSAMLGFLVTPNESDFLSGSLYLKTGRLQAFWHRIINPSWDMICASDLHSKTLKSSDQILVSLDYYGNSSGASLNYSSLGKIIGIKWCTPLRSNIKVGAEVYYTIAEASGSVSIGASTELASKRALGPIILNSSVNPILGHTRFEIASPLVSKDLWVKSRLDYNIYSRLSEFEAALKYCSPLDDFVQVKFTYTKGLGLFLGLGITDDFTAKIGIQAGPLFPNFLNASKQEDTNCIGLELVYNK